MSIEFRTIALCRHDYARLKVISHDTYCRWLESKGHEKTFENGKQTRFQYSDPRGIRWMDTDLYFTISKTELDLRELINAEVARTWAIWMPGDVEENLEIAIAELEALEECNAEQDES